MKLTQREVEVLTLIADGLTSKQIGERLCVSKRTIDFHLDNIYEKFGVVNRIQALRKWQEASHAEG